MKLSPPPIMSATSSGGEEDEEEEEEDIMMPPMLDGEAVLMRARLANSLSYSYPTASLAKAFATMDAAAAADSDSNEQLSSSCFAELRLDKIKKEDLDMFDDDDDEELTSLAWLQDNDLLKNIKTEGLSICTSPPPPPPGEKENQNTYGLNGTTHPPHIPYNPHKHVNSKPPYSFSCLIFMAVEDSADKRLPVKDIYNWILSHFPYFQNAPTGWKNSVRHNLSLNKCFKKVDKEKGSTIGKGSLWMIDPDFRPNLLQALRKTPYHPYHQLQMFNNSPTSPASSNPAQLLSGAPRTAPFTARISNVNSPSPHLFPFLSRRLAQSNGSGGAVGGSSGAAGQLEADIDVANTLVSLRQSAESRRPLKARNGLLSNGARSSRSPSPPEFGSEREKEILKEKQLRNAKHESVVITSSPSDDHTYCVPQPPPPPQPQATSRRSSRKRKRTSPSSAAAAAAAAAATSSDDAYESGDHRGGGGGSPVMYPAADSAYDDDDDVDELLDESDVDEDDVDDDAETEAVYQAAIARIKHAAETAHAAAPSITRRVFATLTAAAATVHHSEEQEEERERRRRWLQRQQEEQKLAESAAALLNLAGIRTEADQVRGAVVSRGASPTMLVAPAVSPNSSNNNNNNSMQQPDLANKMAAAVVSQTTDSADAAAYATCTETVEEDMDQS